MKRLLLFCTISAATTVLIGCGATASYDAPPGFESASLNATYSGPYQRPVVQAGRVPLDSIPSLTGGGLQPGDVGQSGSRQTSRGSARAGQSETRRSRQSRSDAQRSDEHALLIEGSGSHDAPPTTLPEFGDAQPSRGSSTSRSSQRSSDVAPTGNPGLDYVRAVYALNGVEFQTAAALRVVDMYRAVQQQGTVYHANRPVIGDMVFFHNTEDANRDGRNNDWYTHVGIVETVSDDGTVWFLHFHDGEVARDTLNLETITATRGADNSSNSALRHRKSGDPEYTQYLSGDLFAGFGSVLGDRSEFYVIDNWEPGQRSQTHAALSSQDARR